MQSKMNLENKVGAVDGDGIILTVVFEAESLHWYLKSLQHKVTTNIVATHV